MDEVELLERLSKRFPNKNIYNEERFELMKMGVRPFARREGLSNVAWVTSKGYIWCETGYVEPDMAYHVLDKRENGTSFELADWVFRSYPLAGTYQPSQEEMAQLFKSGTTIAQKLLIKKSSVSMRENVVLTLTTIQLLKTRSKKDGNTEDTALWKDIYAQYGFKDGVHKESQIAALYQGFCNAIKKTFEHYNRFFAPEGKQRYYTTLLLHALAPKDNVNSLFDILFDVYTKDLGFQYFPQDVLYKTVVKGMVGSRKESILRLKSNPIGSSLQTLFEERPHYMAVFCDRTVKRMDKLLLNGTTESSADEEYLDVLLLNWFQKMGSTEKNKYRGDKRTREVEFVATTKASIQVQYAMEKEKICLTVPRVRLEELKAKNPMVRLYQENKLIFEQALTVHGTDLSCTTQRLVIPLEKTDCNFSADMILRCQIIYDDDTMYDSEKRLYRTHISFDDQGHENWPNNGFLYLFANDKSEIESDSDIYQLHHKGQLLRMDIESATYILKDGKELYTEKSASSSLRHYISPRPIGGVAGESQGHIFDIYESTAKLLLRLPQDEVWKKYLILCDDVSQSATAFTQDVDGGLHIPLGEADEEIHQVRVKNLVTQGTEFTYQYSILPQLTVNYKKPYFLFGRESVQGICSYKNGEYTIQLPTSCTEEDMQINLPGLLFPLKLRPNLVRCQVAEKNGFTLPTFLWHEDSLVDGIVRISCPQGYTATMALGQHQIHSRDGITFELGNTLRAYTDFDAKNPLTLTLQDNDGRQEYHILTTVLFKPKFLEPPLAYQDGQLFWHIQENYLGTQYSQYHVSIEGANAQQERDIFSMQDEVRLLDETLPTGAYHYQISVEQSNVFGMSEVELICEGTLFSGHPDAVRMLKKELVLNRASYWDGACYKNINLRLGAGIVMQLEYQGEDCPNGENAAYPHYRGVLCFENNFGKRYPFNFGEKDGYEETNPVHVWLINDFRAIVLAETEDGLQLNCNEKTIFNRSPLRSDRPEIPDYFEYERREESRYV